MNTDFDATARIAASLTSDPAELGRRYVKTVFEVLDITDTVVYTAHLHSRLDVFGRRRLDPTLRRTLAARQITQMLASSIWESSPTESTISLTLDPWRR